MRSRDTREYTAELNVYEEVSDILDINEQNHLVGVKNKADHEATATKEENYSPS